MNIARYNPPMSVGGAMIPNDDGHWCYYGDVKRELEAAREEKALLIESIQEYLYSTEAHMATADVSDVALSEAYQQIINARNFLLRESK